MSKGNYARLNQEQLRDRRALFMDLANAPLTTKIAYSQRLISKGLENGRPLLPPMPWFNYTEMKKEDLQAIHAYLKTLKPVENVVPNPVSWEK